MQAAAVVEREMMGLNYSGNSTDGREGTDLDDAEERADRTGSLDVWAEEKG